MGKMFTIKASEAHGRRLDPEYHHALRRTRIRSTYPSAKLLSLSYFRTGGTPSTAHPEYWNGSIPWVSAKDFKAFRFEDSEDHVTELALAESTTCYVNRPAVLMVSRSGILQHTLPVMVTHKPTTINQDIKAFFPDDRVSVDYLGAFFDVFGSRLLPLVCKSGATVQSLNTEQLMDLSIPLPPLSEQRKIVAELDAAYAAKRAADEKATKLLASIDDMVLSELGVKKNDKLDTSLASRIFTVSSSSICNGRFDPKYAFFSRRFAAFKYPTAKLGALLSEPPAYGAGEAGVERISKQQPRYVRITDIDENGDMLPGLGVTAQNIDSAYFLRDGDILFARSGNTVGKTYLHRIKDIQDECIYAGYLIRFRFTDAVLPEYVFAYTQTSYYHEWVQMVQRTAGQPNINAQEYRGMTIPVPPLTVQKRIASKASSIRAEARKLKADATAALESAKRKIEAKIVKV